MICTYLGKKSCRYCRHLWSRPRTFQLTHVNVRRQRSYGTPNVSLRVVELNDSSCIRICTFLCFVAVVRKNCGYRFYNVTAACVLLYSAVHGFWSVVDLAELAEGPAGCGEGWVFICLELQMTRSTVLTDHLVFVRA
jgi:hypothetical protein